MTLFEIFLMALGAGVLLWGGFMAAVGLGYLIERQLGRWGREYTLRKLRRKSRAAGLAVRV